jgi:hypothetical protein
MRSGNGVARALIALVLCTTIGLLAPPDAKAAAVDVFLLIPDVEGEEDYTHGSTCEDRTCVETYSYQWRAGCATCFGVPNQGVFDLVLGGAATDPLTCLTKRVSGALSFTSTDPLYPSDTTSATVSGRLRDHKAFVVQGIASSGAFSGYEVSVFVTFPPNPCEPGPFTAEVKFRAD